MFDFAVVLCSRAENVSNFIQADSFFGPVIFLDYELPFSLWNLISSLEVEFFFTAFLL